METIQSIFPLFAWLFFRRPGLFKFFVLLQISVTSFLMFCVIRSIKDWYFVNDYKMSYVFGMFVFFLTSVTSTVALVESIQKINQQKRLLQKIEVINVFLNISQGHYKARFLKKKFLIFYVVTLVISAVTVIVLQGTYRHAGTKYYIFLATSLVRLRLVQITLWLDQFAARLIFLRVKFQWPIRNERIVKDLKQLVLNFLDFYSLFHECFEFSLLLIVICGFFEFVSNFYWFLLPFFNLLLNNTLPIHFALFYIVGLQIFTVCKICQEIHDEVSWMSSSRQKLTVPF